MIGKSLKWFIVLISLFQLSQFVYSFFPSGGREVYLRSLSISIIPLIVSLAYLILKGKDKIFLGSVFINALPWIGLFIIFILNIA